MALTEQMKKRKLRYAAEECTGTRVFHIDGYAGAASLPLTQLLASYPLGQAWSVDTHSRGDQIPRLRVVSHDIEWIADEQAVGTVYYSTRRDNTRDIQYWYDVGEEIQTVVHEVAGSGLSYSSTRLTNSRNYPKSQPVTIFNYQRAECRYGWWTEGVAIPWATSPGSATDGWGETATGVVTSQLEISQSLVGKLNSTSFLDQNSKTVKYLGATLQPQGPMYDSGSGNEYVFTVTYRFEISTEAHFQYRHPDTGDLKDVLLRGNFGQLGLIWPTTAGGTSLRAL